MYVKDVLARVPEECLNMKSIESAWICGHIYVFRSLY